MKQIFIFMIRLYRTIAAPLLGPSCRFVPGCSAYAEEAIKQKGAFPGAKLAFKRICKCHPFHPGGFDPVEP